MNTTALIIVVVLLLIYWYNYDSIHPVLTGYYQTALSYLQPSVRENAHVPYQICGTWIETELPGMKVF